MIDDARGAATQAEARDALRGTEAATPGCKCRAAIPGARCRLCRGAGRTCENCGGDRTRRQTVRKRDSVSGQVQGQSLRQPVSVHVSCLLRTQRATTRRHNPGHCQEAGVTNLTGHLRGEISAVKTLRSNLRAGTKRILRHQLLDTPGIVRARGAARICRQRRRCPSPRHFALHVNTPGR